MSNQKVALTYMIDTLAKVLSASLPRPIIAKLRKQCPTLSKSFKIGNDISYKNYLVLK